MVMNQVWSDFHGYTIKTCWPHCQIFQDSMESTITRTQHDDYIHEYLDDHDSFTHLDTLAEVAAQISNDISKSIPMNLVLENQTRSWEQINKDENKPSEEDMSNRDSNEYEQKIGQEITSTLNRLKDRMASITRGHEIMMKRMIVFMFVNYFTLSTSSPSKDA